MIGETNLETLLATMSPNLMAEEYVFCSVQGDYIDYNALSPLA
ncbi:MAG TPA: transporter, partial [Colwellia sp.]|nr:transporter [Colwellia sp.]